MVEKAGQQIQNEYIRNANMSELTEISNSPLHAKGNLNHMTGLGLLYDKNREFCKKKGLLTSRQFEIMME